MEFLMTYGWAILAAIIVIGVLAIYFRPGQLTSDSVVVTAPFYGVGVALSPGVIWVEVKNNGGVPVTITGASLDSGCNEATGIGNILSGSTRTLIFDGCLFSYGDLINKDILINYTKVGSSLTLQSKGTISGRVLVNAMSGGDTTPPVLSAGSPSGILAAGTTQINISLTTNETATCRYSMISGVSYGWMINTFSTTGATTHSQLVTGLVNGGNYNYYVRCNDTSGNFNTNDSTISFSVASEGDTIPPDRSIGAPSGILAAGTTQTTISLLTDESSTCRYSMTPGISYDSMTNTFFITGGASHSQLITGLTNGGNYNYYVRCSDTSGNFNTNDYIISFSIASILNHNYVIKSCYNGSNANNICSTGTDCPSGICLEPVVAWWSLDEASGTRAASGGSCGDAGSDCDLSESSGDTIEQNTTHYMEGSASATFYTGHQEYLSCTDATCNELDYEGNSTFGCWVYPTNDTTTMAFMQNGNASGGYALQRISSNDGTQIQIGNGTNFVSTNDASSQPLNTWTHIIGSTINNTTGRGYVYVNGTLKISYTPGPMLQGSSNFALSKISNGQTWGGLLDECFSTNITYTNSQICEICRFGLDGEESDRGSLCGNCNYG